MFHQLYHTSCYLHCSHSKTISCTPISVGSENKLM
nr:MAG TPA: hypothetical protein [Caudoviricetes sp.]